ncbi:MAG: flagellar hook protein FliD [Betaproteobacteria bacterium]|nr:flagellar hook protein FliD [Betaproteobacteria bacterium]
MATSVSGLSNLDVNSIVSQLMTVERQPIALLDKKESSLQTKVSAYGALKGALSVFQGTMTALQSTSRFTSSSVSVTDTTVLRAAAGASAAPGSFDVEVTKTATSQVMKSGGVVSDTATGSTGTIAIQVGTGSIKTVTIDSSNNTLRGMRDAINGAEAGVQASIVNDGSAYRLVLTANDTGTANTISVTNGLAAGELKDALTGLTQARAAQNAEFTVNGVAVSSASNTVTTAIAGATINLGKAGTSKITIARDTAQAQAAVQSFVKGYNDLQATITSLTKFDAATKKAGVLNGDSGTASLATAARGMMGEALTGLSGDYRQLSDIGVAFQKDGTLALDTAKLGTALKASAKDVAALFARQGTSDNALLSYTTSSSATSAGDWQVHVSAAATRAAAAATNAPAATTVIDASNESFSVKIDGTASGTLKLPQGSYTAAQLATLLQNTINGASVFSARGTQVAVSLDGGTLKIESQAYGTASTVTALTGIAAPALGFDGTETGAGTDAAGTFTFKGATYTALGSGQTLNGATGGAAAGLSLQYSGSAAQLVTGADATVKVSEGHAARLARFAEQALATNGVVNTKTESIATTIKDIGNRRDALNVRMDRIEKQLRAQYVALDALMSRMNTTSSFLTQQLASIPSSK